MKEWHCEQSTPGSCVAACRCIVRRFRGEQPTAEELQEEATGRPCPLSSLASLRDASRVAGIDAVGDELEVRLALSRGKVVVALVLGGPYQQWLLRRYPSIVSRHGQLCAPSSYGGAPHAVVLVARSARRLRLLDPYFSSGLQPLDMDDDEFSRCFGSQAYAFAP